MKVRKIRRKCEVRRCSNRDTYSISRSSEPGNTVIICKDCLKEALAEIEKIEKTVKEPDVIPEIKPKKAAKKKEGVE